MDPYPRTWAEVDLGALSRNLGRLRAVLGPGPRLCLVAKADAYGHGLAPVSRSASVHGADWLAVATVSEGVALRSAGVDLPILILSPILPVEADQAVFYRLDVTVESAETALLLARAGERLQRTARLHLKVDTGLSRFGVRPESAVEMVRRLRGLDGAELVGLSTHYVDSRSNPERTTGQLQRFHQMVKELESEGLRPPVVHASNSAGSVLHPAGRFDMVRVGLLAYGIDSAPGCLEGVEPVLSLKSRIVAERWLEPGETVGYLGSWTASRPTRVLTVGAGYGDGVPRHLSSCGFVWVAGRECPIIGLVCMDLLMIDATDAPEAELGGTVELLGAHMPAARVARLAGTNAHEIVTRISARVPRRFIHP
ncbi:MAG: alanine racemase [Fimbriimonadaceae bacterium]|nr:alanine racemase [Fimbriimonadaceae bacterium]